MPKIRNAKRDDQIRLLRTEGYTLREIAIRFGISAPRVHAICEGRHVPRRGDMTPYQLTLKKAADRRCYLRRRKAQESQGMTFDQFRAARESLGLTQSKLAGIIQSAPRSIRHWEEGTRAIPGPVEVLMMVLMSRGPEIIPPASQSAP